ncbi:flagellar assembly protein FliW [Paenibacillus aurantiacus]|uniref:Flagellar assembly factor FliW n=1 Tax=Paenibacillus aurantiacus TaxID=1936118 RepID=A0ABV5KP98_9BACL
MQVAAKRLGNVKVTGSRELAFDQGLPGFEDHLRFALLDLEIDLPIKLLQSLSDPDISLLVGDPFYFYPDYEWELPEHIQQELHISDVSDVEIWSVIILPAVASESTINLLAPIIMNRTKLSARQIILHGSSYSNRHPLMRPEGGAGNQGQGES